MKCDEQQTEQGSEGRDHSDESGVQSAAISIQDCDDAIVHWCSVFHFFRKAGLIEPGNAIDSSLALCGNKIVDEKQKLQREVTKTNT